MTLQDQARAFRETFNQECLFNISHYGFIKKKMWDMQVDLIKEEAAEFVEAAGECFADPENVQTGERNSSKSCLILSLFAINLQQHLTSI